MNKKIVALIAGIVVILIGSFGIYKITSKNTVYKIEVTSYDNSGTISAITITGVTK